MKREIIIFNLFHFIWIWLIKKSNLTCHNLNHWKIKGDPIVLLGRKIQKRMRAIKMKPSSLFIYTYMGRVIMRQKLWPSKSNSWEDKRGSLLPHALWIGWRRRRRLVLFSHQFFFYDLSSISPSLEEKSGKWTTWQLSDKASIHWSPFKGGMGLDWHDYERTTPPFLMGFQFLTRVDKTLIHTTHCQVPTAKILHLVSSCLGFIYDCHLGFHGSFQPFNHMSFVFLHACPHLPHLISSPTFYMHAQPFNTI